VNVLANWSNPFRPEPQTQAKRTSSATQGPLPIVMVRRQRRPTFVGGMGVWAMNAATENTQTITARP
jgi:hypothetical protein